MDTDHNQPQADQTNNRSADRHLRVGILLGQRSAKVSTVWLVDEPAVVLPTPAQTILVRVDLAGRLVSVQALGDPRASRGTVTKGRGHFIGAQGAGYLYVSVPFEQPSDLSSMRIRITDVAGMAFRHGQDMTAMGAVFDKQPPGLRQVHEVQYDDLSNAPEWVDVARRLGLTVDAGRFEIYLDRAGKYRWRLRRADGEIVADSGQGYGTRQACETDLIWIRARAATVPVTSLDVTRP